MSNKTLSILSYITIIGWLISYFIGKDQADDLLKFHLRQSLGVFLTSFLLNIALTIVITIVPAISFLGYVGYAFFALYIIGIINAANEEKKPLPIIGDYFADKFSFIG